MLFLPLLGEVTKEQALPSLEDGKLARSHLIDALGKYGLGFLLVGADRLPTLPPVGSVVSDSPLASAPDDAHYAAPRPPTAVSRRWIIHTWTSCGSKRRAVPRR